MRKGWQVPAAACRCAIAAARSRAAVVQRLKGHALAPLKPVFALPCVVGSPLHDVLQQQASGAGPAVLQGQGHTGDARMSGYESKRAHACQAARPRTKAYAWRDCGLVFSPLRCTLAPCSSTSDPAFTSTGTAKRGATLGGRAHQWTAAGCFPSSGTATTCTRHKKSGPGVAPCRLLGKGTRLRQSRPCRQAGRRLGTLLIRPTTPCATCPSPPTELRVLKAGRLAVEGDGAVGGAQKAAVHPLVVRACDGGREASGSGQGG